MARISRDHARKMFNQGHSVRAFKPRSKYSRWGFQNIASAPAWMTFEELEKREREGDPATGIDAALAWEKPGPSRKTMDVALGHIFRREEFEIGSLSGTHFFAPDGTRGDLPKDWHVPFDEADYAVWSYETPIAWTTSDGAVIIPSVRYSLTTTQHQQAVAHALGTTFLSGSDGSPRAGKGHSPYGPGWQTTRGL